ncbi:Mitochondrial-processing peptidase subunit alpha, partial [Thalictrum thalictroides]
DSANIAKAVDLVTNEFIEATLSGRVNQTELDRAKQSTKSAVLMNLESRMVVSEDIGRQILTYNERKPVDYFLRAVDQVCLNDIKKIIRKMISSPLTMASWGDVSNVPSYESISRRFKAEA